MNILERTKNILHAAALLASKGASNEYSFEEWFKICRYCHERGYLYVGFAEDDEIDLVVIAYRVKKITEETTSKIPVKEHGNILYVQSAASRSSDILKLSRMMHWYMRNNKHVKEIVFHKRNSDSDLRRYKHGKK